MSWGLKLGRSAIRYPAVVPPSWLWRAQMTPAILAGRLAHVDVGECVEHLADRFGWCPRTGPNSPTGSSRCSICRRLRWLSPSRPARRWVSTASTRLCPRRPRTVAGGGSRPGACSGFTGLSGRSRRCPRITETAAWAASPTVCSPPARSSTVATWPSWSVPVGSGPASWISCRRWRRGPGRSSTPLSVPLRSIPMWCSCGSMPAS